MAGKLDLVNPVRRRWIVFIYGLICTSAFLLSIYELVTMSRAFGRTRTYGRWGGEGDSSADVAWFIKLFVLVALWRVGL